MAGIKFVYENYVDSASLSITTGAANAQFPLSNLQNVSTAYKFRSTGNTVVIQLDLLQTRPIDTLLIAGDATSTFGITAASFKTSLTTDFSGSPVYTLDVSATHNMAWVSITEVTHRYVQLTLTGTGSYCEIGALAIGSALNLTQNSFSIGSFKYSYQDRSIIDENRYGQRFIDELPSVKQLSGQIQYCNKTEQEQLDDMFISIGKHKPLWVIIDPSSDGMNEGKYKLTMYSYLEDMPEWSAIGGQHYSTDLNLRQVV